MVDVNATAHPRSDLLSWYRKLAHKRDICRVDAQQKEETRMGRIESGWSED
jgi:hypothetical protein